VAYYLDNKLTQNHRGLPGVTDRHGWRSSPTIEELHFAASSAVGV